jgi:hypothetical protein
MKLPRNAPPLESPSEKELRPPASIDRAQHAVSDRRLVAEAAVTSRSPKALGPGDQMTAGTDGAAAFGDKRSPRPEVAVRVAVIDDADRLVYSDVRNRRGWKQPLAAEQAADEVRRRHVNADGTSVSEPRTVRTLEATNAYQTLSDRNSRAPSETRPTPYRVGKASASANAPGVAEPRLTPTVSKRQATIGWDASTSIRSR